MMKRIYQILIFFGIGLLLFVLSLGNPLLQNTSDFSIYNTGWNGCSTLALRSYEAGVFQPTFSIEKHTLTLSHKSFTTLELEPQNTTLLLIGPQAPFTALEGTYIDGFLREGGTVFLADDFGTGNTLLERLNTSIRFSTKLLLDLSFEKNASFVAVYNFTQEDHPLTDNVSYLLLNYPTALSVGKNTTVLARSSELSWLDFIENGKEDPTEKSGPFPLLATIDYGQGELVICAAPSILINSMNRTLDNQQFRDNLFSYLIADRSAVVFDESHRSTSLPLQVSYTLPTTISVEAKLGILCFVIFLFVVGFTRIPRILIIRILHVVFHRKKTPPPPSSDSHIEELLKKHPTWDKKTLAKIIERIENT